MPKLAPEERAQAAEAKRIAIDTFRASLDDEHAPEVRAAIGLPDRAVALRLHDRLFGELAAA